MVREVCVLLAVAVRTAAADDASLPLLEVLLLTTSRKGDSSCSRGWRKGAASSFPSAESGGWRVELMMLERILNPGLQLSVKNDTVCEQDSKHHCLCTVGKMPIRCFWFLPLLQPVSIKDSATAGTSSLENGTSLKLCLVSKPHCLHGTEGFCLKCL